MRRAAARLPESRRAQLVVIVTRAIFEQLGFTSSKFTATSGGNGVLVVVGASEACTTTPGTEQSLAARIHKGVPWLRSVQIVAGPGNQSLSQYASSHCGPVTLPSGHGPVVLTQTGSTIGSTSSFTVHSPWTVEYVNGSGLFQILPLKQGAPTGKPFTTNKRGPGRYVVRRPGTYSLQILSVGDWTIRVRDGA